MATILIVDDEPDIQALLFETLARDGHTLQIAADGEEALTKAQNCSFDLALVDLWLPRLHGIELLHRLRHLAPDMPVIVMTCRPERKASVLALRLGASDYVPKPFDLKALRATVARALTESDPSPEPDPQWAAEQLAGARAWLMEVEQTWAALTERERQVLSKLAEGKMDATIAGELGISAKTVGHHVAKILAKLGVHSRTEAAVWAVQAGIGAMDGKICEE